MKNVGQFLKEVRIELGKVVWPSYDDFVGSTIVVLVLISFFALYLGGVDAGFAWATRKIFEWFGLS